LGILSDRCISYHNRYPIGAALGSTPPPPLQKLS
jgi:hypothetical protein